MISIILPTFNSIRFLEERVVTILNQTYSKWECIVIDGESSDGTWEYLSNIAIKNKRFQLFKYPPKGVYDAWNKGINHSNGDYIYFATSDDTMTLDCLEKFKIALDKNPDCHIAHCCLTIINEKGEKSNTLNWDKFPTQQFFGTKNLISHKRKAPETGILYCTHNTVIHSFTQVLIRKDVFNKIGLFLTNFGPSADLEWGMRACLCFNTIHIPEYLATWRTYEGQNTSISTFNSWQHKKLITKLISKAIKNSNRYFKPIINIKYYQLWYIKEMYALMPKKIKFLRPFTLFNKFYFYLLNKELRTNNSYNLFLCNKILKK